MSCNDKNQSAIAETRDQLFLDTADGMRLDVVASNLGMSRPSVTIGDDEWRAVTKLVALQPKQIRNAFIRMLEICAGPQYARVGVLSQPSMVFDKTVIIADPNPFVQLGTITIDPTLATEETVKYCIRNLVTGEFFLQTELQFPHVPIAFATDLLVQTANSGSSTLQLRDSSLFPTTYPYPVIVGQGTVDEEIVRVVLNDTSTNTLHLFAPTTKTHLGPQTQFLQVPLAVATPAKRTFVQLTSTADFPATGWIRINENGGTDEVVQYEENDLTDNVLFLRSPLANAHAAAEPVELVAPGAGVSVAQVVESGIHWRLLETTPREVIVILPASFQTLRLLDASWLHEAVPSPLSTTLSTNAAPTDTVLTLTGPITAWPVAGLVLVGGTTKAFYTLKINSTDVVATFAANAGAGSDSITFALDPTSPLPFPAPIGELRAVLNPGGGTQETVTITAVSIATGVLKLAAPTVNSHSAGETIELLDQIILALPFGATFSSGASISFLREPYPGLSLEDGNYRDITGAIIFDHFPGPYIFDPTQRGVSEINTQLAAQVPPETTVVFSQVAGTTNLEVADAAQWPAPPFDPFQVRLGAGSGHQEDQELISRTLRYDATATVAVGVLAGVSAISYTLTSVVDFPQSDGVLPARYRVLIGGGTANAEIVLISQNDTGSHIFSLVAATTKPHLLGETIVLLADVLTFSQLTEPHTGPTTLPSRIGELVQPFISALVVASTTNFPTVNGWVWLNFGKEIINARSRITSVGSATSYVLQSTAHFPTTNYPYEIVIGDGLFVQEPVFVTNNNTGTNTLTLVSPGTRNTHVVGEYVTFQSGTPEVAEYQSLGTSPARLVFSVPQLLNSGHLVGERVILSTSISASRPDGSSFGFKMPPNPGACLSLLFELVRAAGIQIKFVIEQGI